MTDDPKSAKKPGGGGASPWLEWIQRWERTIGEPVESFVRSDAYFDLMTQFNRARSQATHTFEGLWEQWLHLFNMPAATDVRKLREQLSRLDLLGAMTSDHDRPLRAQAAGRREHMLQ